MLINAVILGMLGCIDALLTSVIADSLTRTEHNSDKELIGQGLGNLVSGLFGGLAGAGATMGTVVNIQAGGRTALSGIFRALLLAIVILGATGLVAQIPLAVLAGIALKVGIDIVDWGFLRRAHRLSWKGALIMYGVLLLTVFVDLIVAVGVGVFVANILTIERLSNLQKDAIRTTQTITSVDDAIVLSEVEQGLLEQARGRVLLFQLSGPMIFGVAKTIAREHQAIDNCDAVIFDLSEVPHLGVTASLALENAMREAVEKRRQVLVVGAQKQTFKRLHKLNIQEVVPPENFYAERVAALTAAVAALPPTTVEAGY